MNVFQYAFTRIKRHPRAAIGVLCTYLMAVLVLGAMQGAGESRQAALDSMISNLSVNCAVTDLRGVQTDRLDINGHHYVEVFGHPSIAALVKDVCYKTEYICTVSGVEKQRLVGITREKAVYELAFEKATAVYYHDGYDEAVFQGSEAVCVISQDLQPYVMQNDEGENIIMLTFKVAIGSGKTQEVQASFRVIGEAVTESAIYCPWQTLRRLHEGVPGREEFVVDSLSFTIADNAQLEAFRRLAAYCFSEPDYFNPDNTYPYGLAIHDAQYLKLSQAARKNVALLEFMRPVLYLCALLIGAFIAALQMRGRKKELAILRGMGVKRTALLAQCLIEYAFICLAGTALAFLMLGGASVANLAIVFTFFIFGMLLSVTRYAFMPLISQIRELED